MSRHESPALLTSTAEGVTDYIDANLHDPDTIVRVAAETLDFDKPVALMLMNMLGHVEDYAMAKLIVRGLLDELPWGSYLVSNDGSNTALAFNEAQGNDNEVASAPYILRTPEQLAGSFSGLGILEHGVVSVSRWRLESEAAAEGAMAEVDEYGGVGFKR